MANIASLWLSLIEIYSHLFINKYGTSDSGAWFESLKDLTPLALENGLETLRSGRAGNQFATFPPNCLEFRGLCLAYYEGLRLPSTADAYRDYRQYARSGKWNNAHDAVKLTAKKLGARFLTIERDMDAYPRFKKMYAQVCHLARLGIELPQVETPVLLGKPTNSEAARMHLSHLKQHLGVRSCQ